MTTSLQDARIIRIIEAALAAVEPAALVQRFLATTTLPRHSRLFLLGLGKAAAAMTRGAAAALDQYEAALIITKHAVETSMARATVLEAGHPIPDERSLTAGGAALEFASRAGPDDLLICLISGGGSALACAPVEGVSLGDVRALTSLALSSGTDIEEINNLRRCLDRIKGGGLAAATTAHVLGIILSDVIGDRMDAIASGPTVPGQSDPQRASRLLGRFAAPPPDAVVQILESAGPHRETGDADRVRNVIIGNACSAAEGAVHQARREGFSAEILKSAFDGEAQLVGQKLGLRLVTECGTRPRPVCLIAFGESTVTLTDPHGVGGRNQELALAAAEVLEGIEACMLIALATDGEDGPTDAAGAVVTGTTAARAKALGMDPREYLARHDSRRFFEAMGDLLRPGSTGTNVNDLVMLLAF